MTLRMQQEVIVKMFIKEVTVVMSVLGVNKVMKEGLKISLEANIDSKTIL